MKKPDRRKNAWLLRQRAAKAKRRKAFQCYRKLRNRFPNQPLLVNKFNQEQKQPVNRRVAVELPERLDLDVNYEATVTHLTNVRRASEKRFRLRYLSFDAIKYISPSAALLLASEVDRWNDAVGGRLRARHAAWDPNVKRLLCGMGFFELLHLEKPAELGGVINTTFLPFLRGNADDRAAGGSLAKKLRQEIEAVAGTEIKKHLLFDGLTEAITNVSQHAYPKAAEKSYRPWWMSAAYVKDTNMVVVSFYDHGRTIPGTLPASKVFERMKDQFGLWNDGQKIRAAMELGRSSSDSAGRGKGLQNFLEIIKAHTGSRLRIFSNHGQLTVTNSEENALLFDSGAVETSLHGTLIEWQFVPKNATDAPLDR